MIIISIAAGVAAIGLLIGLIIYRGKLDTARALLRERDHEAETLRQEAAELRRRMEAERATAHTAEEERFRNLANDIFASHTAHLKQSAETRLGELLAPLKADIEGFRTVVSRAFDDDAKERFSLQSELRRLMELARPQEER